MFLYFLNKSISFFSKMETFLKPMEHGFIKIEVPFVDEMQWGAMIKQLDLKTSYNNIIKVTFIRNIGFLKTTSKSSESVS